MTFGEETGYQEREVAERDVFSKKYGPFAELVSPQIEEIQGLDTEVGGETIMQKLEAIHSRTLEILEERGIKVSELEPKEGVSVTPNIVTEKLGGEVADPYGLSGVSEVEKERAWHEIWREAGVIGEGETVEAVLITARVAHPYSYVDDWSGTALSERPVQDMRRGRPVPLAFNLRLLNDVVNEGGEAYRVVSGGVHVVGTDQVDIRPAVDGPNSFGTGTLYLIRKSSVEEGAAAPVTPPAPGTSSTPAA